MNYRIILIQIPIILNLISFILYNILFILIFLRFIYRLVLKGNLIIFPLLNYSKYIMK